MTERERERGDETKDRANTADETRKEPVRLDLEKLDLTVREVEDRIRPGETNVFDK
ncbi:MAG: hypothetical protein R3F34_19580 [Planctomycetota bacterium]